MDECKFTTEYWEHERSGERVDYNCDSKDEDILDSGFCIFHDENYLQDKNNDHKEHEQKVRDRLEAKVRNSIDQNEPLLWASALTI
ncbi:MAG: hypothetical protein WCF03_17545 [Nitrososphaeraceae archaeon]